MIEYLTFNSFITQYVLLIVYYLIALSIPFALFKYYKTHFQIGIWWKFWFVFFMFLFLGELFLRMFFEMLIAYFDMHQYLYDISHNL